MNFSRLNNLVLKLSGPGRIHNPFFSPSIYFFISSALRSEHIFRFTPHQDNKWILRTRNQNKEIKNHFSATRVNKFLYFWCAPPRLFIFAECLITRQKFGSNSINAHMSAEKFCFVQFMLQFNVLFHLFVPFLELAKIFTQMNEIHLMFPELLKLLTGGQTFVRSKLIASLYQVHSYGEIVSSLL